MTPYALLRLAGVLTWLMAGLPIAFRMRLRGVSPATAGQAAAWMIFGAAFWAATRGRPRLPRRVGGLIAAQSAAALAILACGGTGVELGLFVIVATEAGVALSLRAAIAWVLVQTALATLLLFLTRSVVEALIYTGAYLGFQGFGVATSHLAECERRAREELARVNAELIGTQRLLTEDTRLAERLRIARELHDALGHHLAALSLNLELARHLASGEATQPVEGAHALAKLLLAEIRDVVGSLRDEGGIDVAGALTALAAGIPRPRIHLTLPEEGLGIRDPREAHAVFRCIQEIVTNAVRHAEADNLWVGLSRSAGGLRVTARDDGRGAEVFRPGHGLAGMSERLEALGGRLAVSTTPGRGFSLEAFVPGPGDRA